MAQKEKDFVKEIANIDTDFAQWYTDVVKKTQLVDYGPVKGTMVIRPYGYAIWENIQKELDTRFKATGHQNAYFPMFIPYSYLQKESEHIEGFAPEVALVTHVGNTPLAEKLVVRPTSETIICEMYSKWIESYKDLPVLINQWANVVRMEKTTRPFLRTSEFLWQEGHTVHATESEARKETLDMLAVYEEFAKTVLAIPMLVGRKTEKEKFAGAVETYSIEAMMLDGKSLQAGTSHYLGQNFAKPFDIKFLDSDGTHKHPYQTSWGVSTRLIGALIMAHGDERGLCLPPKIAPIQVVLIPIAAHKPGVLAATKKLATTLQKAGIRTKVDDSDQTAGWKFNEYEMKGVPLRIELGPRDIEGGVATVSRRDKAGQKTTIQISTLKKDVLALLDDIQTNMYIKAKVFMDSHIKQAKNMTELADAVNNKNFALSMWCGDTACEDKIKTELAATTRNMPFDQSPLGTQCVCCGKPAKTKVYFGKAY
ncbi:MAG: proline--tRNA ligase [Firmicutes bacterium]|nr:proline--tRNA ligase [Bacillota bacterium]